MAGKEDQLSSNKQAIITNNKLSEIKGVADDILINIKGVDTFGYDDINDNNVFDDGEVFLIKNSITGEYRDLDGNAVTPTKFVPFTEQPTVIPLGSVFYYILNKNTKEIKGILEEMPFQFSTGTTTFSKYAKIEIIEGVEKKVIYDSNPIDTNTEEITLEYDQYTIRLHLDRIDTQSVVSSIHGIDYDADTSSYNISANFFKKVVLTNDGYSDISFSTINEPSITVEELYSPLNFLKPGDLPINRPINQDGIMKWYRNSMKIHTFNMGSKPILELTMPYIPDVISNQDTLLSGELVFNFTPHESIAKLVDSLSSAEIIANNPSALPSSATVATLDNGGVKFFNADMIGDINPHTMTDISSITKLNNTTLSTVSVNSAIILACKINYDIISKLQCYTISFTPAASALNCLTIDEAARPTMGVTYVSNSNEYATYEKYYNIINNNDIAFVAINISSLHRNILSIFDSNGNLKAEAYTNRNPNTEFLDFQVRGLKEITLLKYYMVKGDVPYTDADIQAEVNYQISLLN